MKKVFFLTILSCLFVFQSCGKNSADDKFNEAIISCNPADVENIVKSKETSKNIRASNENTSISKIYEDVSGEWVAGNLKYGRSLTILSRSEHQIELLYIFEAGCGTDLIYKNNFEIMESDPSTMIVENRVEDSDPNLATPCVCLHAEYILFQEASIDMTLVKNVFLKHEGYSYKANLSTGEIEKSTNFDN